MTVLDTHPNPSGANEANESANVQALFEEAKRRRRRRHRVASAVVAVVLLLATAITFLVLDWNTGRPDQTTSHKGQPMGTSVPRMPSQMVVWAQSSPTTTSIEVISSKTGRVLRTLATDYGLFRSTPQPAVSTSGTVYFDDSISGSGRYPGPGSTPPREQIMSVPLAGGTARVVAEGHDPAVSPNGEWLAYKTFTDITDQPEAIIVTNLVSGTSTLWQFSSTGPDMEGGLFWAPDSRSLTFSATTLVRGTWTQSTNLLVLSSPNRSLDALPHVPLPLCPVPTPWAGPGAGRDMQWAGFLNATDGIGTCYHAGLTTPTDWTQPVVVNLATGKAVARLPVIPGQLGMTGFQVDSSGHYATFIGEGAGAGGVYRWTINIERNEKPSRPVLVKDKVGSASWVPPNL